MVTRMATTSPDLATLFAGLRHQRLRRSRGRIVGASGSTLTALLPRARVGEVVEVRDGNAMHLAEVIAFRDHRAMLVPADGIDGVSFDAEVASTGASLRIPVGDRLLGRIVDGLGRPLDGPLPPGLEPWAVRRPAPSPLERRRIVEPLPVGLRAIDGLAALGRGQRLGLFAGAGVGKSTLLDQIADGAEADVVVRCAIGERGREVRDLIGDGVSENSVLVVATADQSSWMRQRAPFVATAIAEWFRDRGANVVLLLDSLTRFARAQRELGLEVGEAPTRHGYPPSVFASLPRLLERAGTSKTGSITAIYTVLVAGDDVDEPIADEVRGLLDGHVVLSRALAARGRRPAVDVVASLSRVMNDVTSPGHQRAADHLRALVAAYEAQRELLAMDAYVAGADPLADRAIARREAIEAFLGQARDERSTWDETIRRLKELAE